MQNPKLNSALKDVFTAVVNAVEEWKKKNTEEFIRQNVFKMLDLNSKEITLKLLGFDSRYGSSFQIDRCNGRAGNSPAGDFLKIAQETAIKDWLASVPMPDLTKKEIFELEKEFRGELKYHLRNQLKERVQTEADRLLNELLQNVSATDVLNNYMVLANMLKADQDATNAQS